MKYRAAVVGCGRVGVFMELDRARPKPATHAGAFAACPRIELSAFVDVDEAKLRGAAQLFPDVATYTDLGGMLRECQPEIVAVATPPDQHRRVVEMCALAGVRVIICEKPMALTRSDAEAIVRVCRDSHTILLVNHTRRFDPLLRELSKNIRNGAIGELYHGTCYYAAGLFNNATHLVDLVRFLTGREVIWVSGVPERRFPSPLGDINVNGWLVLDGGVMLSLHALDARDYAIFELHLYGSRGAVLVDRFGFNIEILPVADCQDFDGYRELARELRTREGMARSFFAPMAEHVVACLEGTVQPLSSGEDGLNTLEVLLALRESALREGQRVYLREGTDA